MGPSWANLGPTWRPRPSQEGPNSAQKGVTKPCCLENPPKDDFWASGRPSCLHFASTLDRCWLECWLQVATFALDVGRLCASCLRMLRHAVLLLCRSFSGCPRKLEQACFPKGPERHRKQARETLPPLNAEARARSARARPHALEVACCLDALAACAALAWLLLLQPALWLSCYAWLLSLLWLCLHCSRLSTLTRFPFHDSQVFPGSKNL